MSTIEITCCDICNKDVFHRFEDYNGFSYSKNNSEDWVDEKDQYLYNEEMDICWDCFKKHILPLKKENNLK